MTGTDGAGPAAGSPAESNKGGWANHSRLLGVRNCMEGTSLD